jgi:GNAT superfamily N-acetyltransferase
MGVEVRPARPGEERAIAPLYEWLFAPPGARPPGWDEDRAADRLADVIASEGSDALVGDDGGELVGICTVYLDILSVRFGLRAWVEDLAVHPERRSEGVGKRLLDAAKVWARERDATHLELDSGLGRLDAHRFYEREGAPARSFTFGWEL